MYTRCVQRARRDLHSQKLPFLRFKAACSCQVRSFLLFLSVATLEYGECRAQKDEFAEKLPTGVGKNEGGK
ncbi:hypothetical protein POVWA2_038270 [Plasmodium ovale wallikeri]|uniref:Uncharacterized protein n=1 Tax=Plasmodium ovale wallikeri TaxID=864142 RepID=A0A1A8Z5Z4_PLAOA|nr:hypothetical protein POVWA1_039530 [Plasmodium ovale wallikeri]SBT39730.1 hypothetical protein POVWA2_038270 [Plasmodium ovale wallikeri]